MSRVSFSVPVIQYVTVELDDSKFGIRFCDEFNKNFSDFGYSLEAHAEHLAQLEVQGLIPHAQAFVEGYGRLDEMGIHLKVEEIQVEEPVQLTGEG